LTLHSRHCCFLQTYHAIQRLKAADPTKGGGLYCGPLRLLALEIYDTLNRSGISTDLLTGQERKLLPGSTHTSSTVEMVNINRNYDVAVVDEIQMIADRDRACAW
jgi:ATP-dependent RNA helicase SUPV3L1/SUV3